MRRNLLLTATLALVVLGGAGWITAQQQPTARQRPQTGAPKTALPKTAAPNPAAPKTAAPNQAAPNTPAQPAARPSRQQDEQAIRAASETLAKAFASGDAKAVAALFTAEAEYVDEDSEPIRGRDELAKAYQGFFTGRKQVNAEVKTDKIRFLGNDTAVEEGTFTVTAQGSRPNASRFSALYAREGGQWRIALLKEWSDEETNAARLDDLAWLIGTWETDGGEVSARTTYSWTPNKAFIRADFTINSKLEGVPSSSGTQVIGIDPAVGQIRAWLFASDGGIGESTWIWDDDRWLIESSGTLADGSSTSAVNLLTRSGNDAFVWRSGQRSRNGEPEPDIAPVTVKRVAKTAAAPRESTR
jgi:uncharacterized protein (TIGR02246 family)